MDIARLFVAIELPEDLCHGLDRRLRLLRQAWPGTRWVQPEALHVTLLFLGDTPLERRGELDEAIGQACRGHAARVCRLGGVGVFPDARRPAVLWVGLDDGGALGRLADDLRRSAARTGFAGDERPFTPHLTLGRVRRPGRPAAAALDALRRPSYADLGTLAVEQVSLVASTLTPAGPRYSTLRRWPLGAPADAPEPARA